MYFVILLGIFSLFLSASFSGVETAFYRTPRLRLKLDAMSGDISARQILWFVNRPGIFVSTVLVGNNIANYSISATTVILVGLLLPDTHGIWVELSATIIVAPFLFVYGEMFPKYLGLYAPNRFLRFLSPVMMFFMIIFLPVTLLLWGVNYLAMRFLGVERSELRLSLNREELTQVLAEGHDTGIIFDAQKKLTNAVLLASESTIDCSMVSKSFFPLVTIDMEPVEVIGILRGCGLVEVPVYATEDAVRLGLEVGGVLPDNFEELPVGFVRLVDLDVAIRGQLDEQTRELLQLLQTKLPLRSMIELSSRHSILTAMILMQTLNCPFGCVINEKRANLGFVQANNLVKYTITTKETQ
ncbi:MAG: DUF21 domain-containing protein [Planctomycetaceae bacterium]|jgi:CBS domain containing-hemolysin-like protein|nr:DUF21 domain-containing protein [Planctomycetaceae bacterium]